MAGIVIVGGGVIGSSIAYYLRCAGADVTVIEPDPTYEFAATPRAIGGIRMLHGVRENVEMSRYGYQVFRDFKRHVSGGSVDFDPAFREVGYLFMVAGPAAISALERSAEMQRALGVDVTILDRSELGARYPSFAFPGVDAAAYSPADGQIDPNAALMGYRRAAQGRGAVYLQDRVCGIDVVRGAVSAVRLASGASLATRQVVNAANCWAPEVCAMVGMPVPIAPMRRQQFFFTAQSLDRTDPGDGAMRRDSCCGPSERAISWASPEVQGAARLQLDARARAVRGKRCGPRWSSAAGLSRHCVSGGAGSGTTT